jgi:CO dehydrogenase/acetyl-CoA synthase alpha subunit
MIIPVLQPFVLVFFGLANILLLEGIPTTPYCKREYKQDDPSGLCSCSSPDIWEVESEAEDGSSEHLRDPVDRVVECASAWVELRKVDVLILVRIEPVGSKEHREEKYDVRVIPKSFPEAQELGFPSWMLH